MYTRFKGQQLRTERGTFERRAVGCRCAQRESWLPVAWGFLSTRCRSEVVQNKSFCCILLHFIAYFQGFERHMNNAYIYIYTQFMMPGSVSFDDIRNLICSHLHQNRAKILQPEKQVHDFMHWAGQLLCISPWEHAHWPFDVPSQSMSANWPGVPAASIVQLHTFWAPLYNGRKADISWPGSAQASSAGEKVGCWKKC